MGSTAGSPDPTRLDARPALVRPVVAIAATLGLVLAALTGFWVARLDGPPSSASAEAGFARDMQTHHAQAVEMAFLIRDRSEDADVRRMAFDMITSQQAQIGSMSAWLTLWGLSPTGDDPPMTWMAGSHSGHGSSADPATPAAMPGMTTTADLARLADADGVAAEKLFLELMIAHHNGGVEMAKAVLERTQRPEVRNLAQSMVNAQSAEIQTMTQMLAARG